MRVRLANTHEALGHSSEFNTSSLSEVIVYYDDGGADSEYMQALEVWLSNQTWVNMRDAFAEKQLICDNYNRYFREPKNDDEMLRGWFDA